MAMSLNNLAGLYYFEGRLAEVEPLFKAALEIDKRRWAPITRMWRSRLSKPGRVAARPGTLRRLRNSIAKPLVIYERALGCRAPRRCQDTEQPGDALPDVAPVRGGRTDFPAALAIRETLGPDHPEAAAH